MSGGVCKHNKPRALLSVQDLRIHNTFFYHCISLIAYRGRLRRSHSRLQRGTLSAVAAVSPATAGAVPPSSIGTTAAAAAASAAGAAGASRLRGGTSGELYRRCTSSAATMRCRTAAS